MAGRFAANLPPHAARSASVRWGRLQPNLPRRALERFATSASFVGAAVGADGTAAAAALGAGVGPEDKRRAGVGERACGCFAASKLDRGNVRVGMKRTTIGGVES